MKRLFILISCIIVAGYSHAASVYVDTSDGTSVNELQLAPDSSDDIVFHVSTDGAAFAADSYTPVLFVSKTTLFRTDETLMIVGTASGATATFSASDIKAGTSKDGWAYQLTFRSGSAGAYTYAYQVNGKLVVNMTPLSITGSPLTVSAFGGNKEMQTALSVTNGATLTPMSGTYVLNGIGGANDTTNTITLANATTGQSLRIIVAAASTNLITIADSGNVSLSSAWLGDASDVIDLIGVGTNWTQTGESNN